jgi:hypothetical protein
MERPPEFPDFYGSSQAVEIMDHKKRQMNSGRIKYCLPLTARRVYITGTNNNATGQEEEIHRLQHEKSVLDLYLVQ